MLNWNQDEAVAYECAREVITDMISICTAAITEEEARANPDRTRIATLEAETDRLWQERNGLSVTDHAEIARIRAEYGAKIRAHRTQFRQQAA